MLRASTACLWILECDDIPPIHFPTMVGALVNANVMQAHIAEQITGLISLKATKNESYLHTGEAELIAFMQANIKTANENATKLTGFLHKDQAKQQLDQLLQDMLRYVDKTQHGVLL